MRLPTSTNRSTALAVACFALFTLVAWGVIEGFGDGAAGGHGAHGHGHDHSHEHRESDEDHPARDAALVFAVGFFPALIEPRRVMIGAPALTVAAALLSALSGGIGLFLALIALAIGGTCTAGALVGGFSRALYDRLRPARPAAADAEVFD